MALRGGRGVALPPPFHRRPHTPAMRGSFWPAPSHAEEITGPANVEDHFLSAVRERLGRDEEITAVVSGPDGARLVGTTRQLMLVHHDGVGGILAECWPLGEVENVVVVDDFVLIAIRSLATPVAFALDPLVEEPDLQALTVINLERARLQAQTSGRSRPTNTP